MENNKKPLVDKEAGLELSYGSKELYDEIIEAYLEEYPKYVEGLNNFLAEKNWREYTVIAHAIKSNSKQIGAEELYDVALKSELLGKEADEEGIRSNHDKLIKLYSDVVEFIKNGFNFVSEESETESNIESDTNSKAESNTETVASFTAENSAPAFDDSSFNYGLVNRDIIGIIRESYYKILIVNLTTGTHEDLLIRYSNESEKDEYSENIEQWLKAFAKKRVHKEDRYEYDKKTDFNYLKNHFKSSDKKIVVRYRRLVNDEFRWSNMVIKKSGSYSPNAEYVILYVYDMQSEMSNDAIVNQAMMESFEIFSEGIHHRITIEDLMQKLNDFYRADGTYLVKTDNGEENITLSIVDSESKPNVDVLVNQFGNTGHSLKIYNPKMNNNSLLLLRFVSSLIYNIYISKEIDNQKQNLNEQYKIIKTLSDIYFCVYHVNLETGDATLVSAPEYIQEMLGKVNSMYNILPVVEKYFVTDEYRERVHIFHNVEDWKKKFKERNSISYEFIGPNMGWTRSTLIVSARNVFGEVTEILYAVQEINGPKKRELEYNEKLKFALEEAQKANVAKSIFLSNMSHDIRTPMNAIISFTNLAIAHFDDKETVKEYLENIATSGKHLMSLINSVLDMSRIESGKIKLMENSCDVCTLVEEIYNIIAADIKTKTLTYEMNYDEITHKNILCDSLRLNQVLINLLGNSIKYTKSGGKISFLVKENPLEDNTKAEYEFVVSDDGVGMSKEFLKSLFDPFEREETSTNSGVQGTGLGMAITKNIVEMMGGSVTAESEKNVGTTITVKIPFSFCDETTDVKKETKKEDFSPVSSEGKRILLVEDNKVNRQIAHAILSDRKILLEDAENGEEAVEIYKNSQPGYYCAILMDVQMPIMNGYEATRAIRQLENKELAKIPIIAMTANAFEEDKKESLAAGMNAHILKPIDVDILINTLKEFIK